ncbi:MAG: geranylgeranylglycerol-phosphate geranylgeranyltransferase [Bacteroidota bacterium]
MFRDARYFLLISRPINVAISLLTFGVSCFIATQHQFEFLQDARFWATALTIVVIAATGYWINDVYDFRIDRINKPGKTVVNAILSVKKVLTVYFICIGLILLFSAYFLAWRHQLYHISFINGLSVVLLFMYASILKGRGIPGNLTIAFLIALVIILAGFLYQFHLETLPLVWTIIFAFEITLIREITKDVEDIRGDLQFKLQTLPIQIGIRRTKYVLLVLLVIFFFSTYLPLAYHFLRHGVWIWPYLLASALLVQVPSVWLFFQLKKAVRPEDFGQISRYLKYLMLCGIVTLFFL